MLKWRHAAMVLGMVVLAWGAGCADEAPVPEAEAPYLDADPADLAEVPSTTLKRDLGVPATFGRNNIMSDDFFTNVDAVDAAAVQRFLESTPYGGRSWLASAQLDGKPASQALVEASREAGINPVVMLARMQVESSLINRSTNPGSRADYAFGCGCPDGRSCSSAYRGLARQVKCAGDTLRGRYEESVAGSGIWNRGVAKRTSDRYTVTPENHATASLYTYTPWVLPNRGGNWLVWNVTRRFAVHFEDLGLLREPGSPKVDATPMGVAWEFEADLRTINLTADAPEGVARVEYFVEDYLIGAGDPEDNFSLRYRFNGQKADRQLDVVGYDAAGKAVGLATGRLDTDASIGLYIRQVGAQTFEMGIERPTPGAVFVELVVDGTPVTDDVSGKLRTDRMAVLHTYSGLGTRRFELSTFNADGSYRGTLRRTFEVW